MITRNIERVKKNGEVFTPGPLVNDMLNKLPDEVWQKNKTFCDPACGDGNFLVNVLQRKIDKGHPPLEALKTIYGVDIMRDNILECSMRLLQIVKDFEPITEEHIYTVMRNIVWLNQKRYPGGSLDYDFSFKNGIKAQDVDRWMKFFYSDDINEDLPVPEGKRDWDGSDLFEED